MIMTPPAFRTNAICVLSGDQAGYRSCSPGHGPLLVKDHWAKVKVRHSLARSSPALFTAMTRHLPGCAPGKLVVVHEVVVSDPAQDP
jgi:hypothetical protein